MLQNKKQVNVQVTIKKSTSKIVERVSVVQVQHFYDIKTDCEMLITDILHHIHIKQ